MMVSSAASTRRTPYEQWPTPMLCSSRERPTGGVVYETADLLLRECTCGVTAASSRTDTTRD